MLKLIKILFVVATVSMTCVGQSVAASFDCGKASTDTEKAICADPQLSKLDDVLAELYQMKRSINFSSEELSMMTDMFNFPGFLSSQTRKEQVGWIENIQKKCYGDTNCLVHAYLNRIQEFYVVDTQQDTKTWRILTKLDNPNSDYSTSIWSFNNNESNEPGCFADNFQGVFYVVTIYDKLARKLIAVSPSLIDSKDNGCLEYEIELIPNSQDALSIEVGAWMSAGSWGTNTHVYNFRIADDSVYMTSYRYHEHARNVHLFQTKILDFEMSLLTIDLYNGSDELKNIFGINLKPEDEFVIKRNFDKVVNLNFRDVNQYKMYELMDQIQEQLSLKP